MGETVVGVDEGLAMGAAVVGLDEGLAVGAAVVGLVISNFFETLFPHCAKRSWDDQRLCDPQLFCSSIRGRPCRDRMSKRSPSADDDDRDRFDVTKSRKRSSNKGGGGGSIQSKENCSLSPFVQVVLVPPLSCG